MKVTYDLWLRAWADHGRLTRELASRPATVRVPNVVLAKP